MTRQEIIEHCGEEVVFYEGLDEALIGFAQRMSMTVALYDADRCIEVLQSNEGMDEEEAREYFDYNILNAWVGDQTPVFAWTN